MKNLEALVGSQFLYSILPGALPTPVKQTIMGVSLAISVSNFAVSYFNRDLFGLAGSALVGVTNIIGILEVNEAARLNTSLGSIDKLAKELNANKKAENDLVVEVITGENKETGDLRVLAQKITAVNVAETSLQEKTARALKTMTSLQVDLTTLRQETKDLHAKLDKMKGEKEELAGIVSTRAKNLKEEGLSIGEETTLIQEIQEEMERISKENQALSKENKTLKGRVQELSTKKSVK